MSAPSKRPIFALTVHQPWAHLIAHGPPRRPKRVENRGRCPSELRPGDFLAIHAGVFVTRHGQGADYWRGALELYEARKPALGTIPVLDGLLAVPPRDRRDRFDPADRYVRTAVPYGAVVAVATYAGAVDRPVVVDGEPDPWFVGPWGWLLEDVVTLPEPVPCRGDRWLWQMSGDVLAAVRDGYRTATAAATPESGR